MPVINRIADYAPDMTAWRRHLHQTPELGFDTEATAAFVVEKLREFGVDAIETGVAQNGVVAVIEGRGPGPVTGLRADMDALPIQEVRDLPHKSTVPGKMHACGHDGHTTMLLGAARYLAETRNFAGRAVLLFQPAEEGQGGGRVMVEEGVMDRHGIEEVYGLHNWPGAPVGQVLTALGPLLAATDTFEITVTGRGGHAAKPHETRDPIPVAAALVGQLQTIAARVVDPVGSAVVSVTQVHAGTAFNVIPDSAMLRGTVRTLDAGVRDLVEAEMARMVPALAEAHGQRAEIAYHRGYPVTVNDPEAASFAADVARGVVADVITDAAPTMGGEDFAYMLEARKGAYLLLGAGEGAALHHAEYDFNDTIAPIGASILAKLVESRP